LWSSENSVLIIANSDTIQFLEASTSEAQAPTGVTGPETTETGGSEPVSAAIVEPTTVTLQQTGDPLPEPDATSPTADAGILAGPDRPAMAKGWAAGEHYVLARDAAGWSIAEPGQNHRVVYVSLTGKANADGLTPGTAVNLDGLDALMKTLLVDPALPKAGSVDASWHVLFERGHDYGHYAPPYVSGEDPLHPFVIGAYGSGSRPVFGKGLTFNQNMASDVLVRDIEFAYSPKTALVKGKDYKLRGIDVIGDGHSNLMFENLVVKPYNSEVRLQSDSDNITFYRTAVLDAHRERPANGAGDWKNALANRISGIYANFVDGLLIEQSLFDQNGWEKGYKPSGARGPLQPPSMYSHNLYLNYELTDVTLRDNIIAQAASVGTQLRSGGVIDGTLFFDNNAGLNMLGGGTDANGNYLGQYGFLIDSVITNPSNKDAISIGARGTGAEIKGSGAVVDTIVAQDGDAPGSGPTGVRNPLRLDGGPDDVSVDGATIYNWGSVPDRTLTTADAATLNRITLDRFAASVLGAGKDRFDLLDLWRDRDLSNWDSVPGLEDVLAFFRDGFGYDTTPAAAARTVHFEADPRTDGFRWDNRLNWTDDRGPVSGDTVRLDGHAVTYGGETLRLAALDLGEGGALRVTQALLEVVGDRTLTVGAAGGRVLVDNAGQFLFNGYGGPQRLALTVDGGRAVNTGIVDGLVDLAVSGGQLLLAEAGGRFDLDPGSRLEIKGDGARVGFDAPSGTGMLRLDGGALVFVFDDNGVTPITEFRSGRHGMAEPGVATTLNLTRGTIVIDVSALDPAAADRRFTLVDTDRLRGSLDNVSVEIVGSAPGMDPELVWDTATTALYLDIGGQALL
jgi:hypothetical protein